jgi:hypothetical protein
VRPLEALEEAMTKKKAGKASETQAAQETRSVDEQFNDIIQDALRQAERVDCPKDEYVRQIGGWREQISIAISAATDEEHSAAAQEEVE